MMEPEVQSEIKKLKRLQQYKNTDESVLEKQASKNVVLRDLIESGNFLDAEEKGVAKKIFNAYLEKLDYENFSDLSTLSTLVYSEVLLKRVEKSINKCTNKDGESYLSDKLLKSYSDLTNQTLHLKEKLGINREEHTDEMSALQLLKKRFHQFIQENKHEFMLYVPFTCQKCNCDDVKPILLRRRVKDFEVLEHCHFSGRFWYNKSAMDMVKDGTLSKEAYAKIFSTSIDYVDWCLNQEGRILPTTKPDDK